MNPDCVVHSPEGKGLGINWFEGVEADSTDVGVAESDFREGFAFCEMFVF